MKSKKTKSTNNLKKIHLIAITPDMTEKRILDLLLENFKKQGIEIKNNLKKS